MVGKIIMIIKDNKLTKHEVTIEDVVSKNYNLDFKNPMLKKFQKTQKKY